MNQTLFVVFCTLPMYNIIRSMSRAGTPTDNAAMEAINGWVKAELFTALIRFV